MQHACMTTSLHFRYRKLHRVRQVFTKSAAKVQRFFGLCKFFWEKCKM